MNAVGSQVILSSTFTGGPRYMRQLYQDAMAIVRKKGKPDLFITMTANPKLPEIIAELLEDQKPADHPDLISRVFRQKLNLLMKDLTDHGYLGKVVAHVHVIEFQKRGLPHAHMLLIFENDEKPRDASDYDALVCAEIPDAQKDEFMKELENFLMVGATAWSDAGRADHADFFKKMAEDLEEIAKQAKWFDNSHVIWAN